MATDNGRALYSAICFELGQGGYECCDNPGYFQNIQDLIDTAIGEDFEIPDDFVWCEFRRVFIDFDMMISNALKGHHEYAHQELSGMEQLKFCIIAFNDQQGAGTIHKTEEKLPPEMITIIRQKIAAKHAELYGD